MPPRFGRREVTTVAASNPTMTDRSLARTKEIVLLITAVGLPLVFYGEHEDQPFNITKLSLLFAGVSCGVALHVIQLAFGHRTRGVPAISIPALALTLPLLVSWALSPYQEWALFGQFSRFNGLLPYALFAVLGVLLVDSFWDRPRTLGYAIAATGAVVGAYAFVQAVGLDPLWKPGRDAGTVFPPSTIGHYNFAGGFLAISLPFSIFLWVRQEPSWVGMVATVATILGLVMTNSQGGWIAAVVGLLILGGAFAAERWHAARIVSLVAAAVLVAALVVGVVISADATRPLLGATAKTRGLLWVTAVEMGADSPLVGRGPAAYAVEGVRYRPLEYVLLENNTKADDPHSVPLSFWANAGALGGIGFLLFTFWILRRGVRLPRGESLGAAFFAGCVAYLVQSLVSIDEPSLRAGLWVSVAGLAICATKAETARTSTPRSFRLRRLRLAIGLTVALAIASAGVWYSVGLMRTHRDVVRAKALFDEGAVGEAQELFTQATRFRFEPHYLSAYAFDLGLAALQAEDDAGPLIARMGEVNRYLGRFPETSALLTAARIYFYWGQFEASGLGRAEEILLLTEPLDPENPDVEVHLAQVHLAQDDASTAVAILEPLAPSLTGDVPGFWGTLAVARRMNGEIAGADAAMQQALALNPNHCNVLIARALYERTRQPRLSAELSATLGLNCPVGDRVFLENLIEQRAAQELTDA
ncbi:MAG TPA: O-antigen ligase family protein [Actinomycetota bacterium]|nr:O-antigen ligase family protein [Actinomycetota bacterium]